MPGMFCEAIVTMNSGSAMLTVASQVNSGVTNTGIVSETGTPARCSRPCSAAQAVPSPRTPGTA